jgi:hypothetical protein
MPTITTSLQLKNWLSLWIIILGTNQCGAVMR